MDGNYDAYILRMTGHSESEQFQITLIKALLLGLRASILYTFFTSFPSPDETVT